VTTEGAAIADAAAQEDEGLFCYRHPDRETYVRCGRCDRPICSRCAMQGPVGFRCRECGKPTTDPLTSFTPAQVATGGGVALTGGLVSGLAGSLGLLGLCVALFAGGFAAEAVYRRIGYKSGPALNALIFGGLILGTLAGYAVVYSGVWLPIGPVLPTDEAMGAFVAQTIGWALLVGAVACFGARSRLR
jgi:hypothetical protein